MSGASVRSIFTSTARGSNARTSSANPARAASCTYTRSQASPTVFARFSRSASVPRTVRSCHGVVSGCASTRAGTPGAVSTTSTPFVSSVSPKSTWIGEPAYQVGAGAASRWVRCKWPSAT